MRLHSFVPDLLVVPARDRPEIQVERQQGRVRQTLEDDLEFVVAEHAHVGDVPPASGLPRQARITLAEIAVPQVVRRQFVAVVEPDAPP